MNSLIESYIQYIETVRRYSKRTSAIYHDALEGFCAFSLEHPDSEAELVDTLDVPSIRNYEVHLLDEKGLDPRTVNLHLSVLSGFCRYLVMHGELKSNPARLVTRPKESKRLPVFYRNDAMNEYMAGTEHSASEDELEILESFGRRPAGSKTAKEMYERRLRRMIVSLLHATGMRRAEMISLNVRDLDMDRRMLRITGKGDKTRMIPVIPSLCEELSLYMEAVESFVGVRLSPDDPLLMTPSGHRLYPVYVDRAVKDELGGFSGITGRKSPHVLRHTLATELLNDGADLNSIKELLGHSSLAATQVYTHNSIEKLKKVYSDAHPRAKKD